jgi:3-deoxy-7-phosphoheptulonate synthase
MLFSAFPVETRISHLPVIVDPSHAVGIRAMVSSAGLAAVAAGADGLTVEVHPRPDSALSDGPQSLYPSQFERLMRDIEALAPVVGKELLRTPRAGTPRVGTPRTGAAQAKASGTAAGNVKAAVFSGAVSGAANAELPAAFAGENGAYAEQALMRAFGEDAPRLSCPSFASTFDALLDGQAGFAVVPVENSLTGSIHENYDLFLRYPDVAVVGELKLRIVHCLIAHESAALDTIVEVRSHSQGFGQCEDFLKKYAWSLEPYYNTAAAVASLLNEKEADRPRVAAIAGEAAAKAYGLKILKDGIETNPLNYTRFVIAARKNEDGSAFAPPSLGSGKLNKASLIFSVPDEPGALFNCLKIMSDRGINLSKLESRPIQGKPWQYQFYVDLSLPETEEDFSEVLEALKTKTADFYFLGAYRGAA